MSKTTLFLFPILVFLCLYAPDLSALETEPSGDQHARIRLLSAPDSIGDETEINAALAITLEEGWHTYWRIPGDAGLPPRFDWSESKNVQTVTPLWPAPTRFEEMGLQTFGYAGTTIFPLQVKLEDGNTQTTLSLDLKLMVCKDICIPLELSSSLNIPAGTGHTGAQSHTIEKAHDAIPQKNATPDLKIQNVVLSEQAAVISVWSKMPIEDNADVILTIGNRSIPSPPKVLPGKSDPRQAMFTIARPDDIEDFNAFAAGKTLNVLFTNDGETVEQEIRFPPPPTPSP